MKPDRARQLAGPAVSLVFLGLAGWVLHRELAAHNYHEIVANLRSLPRSRIALAGALTALSYIVMTGYDALGFRHAGHPLPYRRIAPVSFISFAFSNSVGNSLLLGGSIRYYLYAGKDVPFGDIARVAVFCTLSIWLGIAGLAGAVFLLDPFPLPAGLPLPMATVRPLGALLVLAVGGYLALCWAKPGPMSFRRWEFRLPRARLAAIQTGLACLDIACAGAVMYSLMPPVEGLTYGRMMGMYLLAILAGSASQVPGGLGVLEGSMLLMMKPYPIAAPALIGSLLAYRIVYYLVPLGAGMMALGAHETLARRQEVKQAAQRIGAWIPLIVPPVFAFLVFLAGAILLLSGATPPAAGRLHILGKLLPLPLIETSHFLGSLIGVGLLILARGLQRRLDAAYHLAIVFLAVGAAISLSKGFDYEEALILTAMMAALLPCRRHFYRKAALTGEALTPGWTVALVLVLFGSIWVGFFSFRHVHYTHNLWWKFDLHMHGQASRFLRASLGAVAVAALFGVRMLLRPAPPEPSATSTGDIGKALEIVRRSRRASNNLVAMGDKQLLFSDNGEAFLMFGVHGRSWVAMGDPAGPAEAVAEIVWRFRELSDRHGGWTVFYEVDARNLFLYLELGLRMVKIGEEAHVPLAAFSMEGKSNRHRRNLLHRLEREGCRFEIAPADGVPSLMPQLKTVSDAWLSGKGDKERDMREKGFSLGFFDESYLSRFPVALVRKENEILAFANVWEGGGKEELSVDLMRYLPGAEEGLMDFLFLHLMLWGKEQGYGQFDLGMAPFSGFEERALAPLWSRLGAAVFRHGERFYNFQGLRQYKEKFDPVWEPKYLAHSAGLALPRVLIDLAALISRGPEGKARPATK